jgi:enamine deaminase RidA (YjgF/YER057c/UK114 family)
MAVIRDRFRYNPGVLRGRTLFLAGQVGRDSDLNIVAGTEAQTIQAFDNIKTVLLAAGGTFDDIVDMTTYHVDMRDKPIFREVRDRYFLKKYPAWTSVAVSCLSFPGLMVEIKCTAFLKPC